MHLLTIAAFAGLFWQSEEPGLWVLLSREHVGWIWLAAVGPLPVVGLVSWWAARRGVILMKKRPDLPHAGPQFHHRFMGFVRLMVLAHFAGILSLTDWPALFATTRHPALQIFADLATLSPFVVGLFLTWLASFPIENVLRGECTDEAPGEFVACARPWGLSAFMDFQIRHQFLIVAVPMLVILFCANLCRGYESRINALFGWNLAAETLLGVCAAAVFVVSPVLLRRIWRTAPLEEGLIRDRLEAICQRVGLRCREILVWKSDGLMINAAVMGLVPQCRYVMLSDGLLASMNVQQIEAVFGHEAGHVRHRHIQYFLLFALVGWFVVAGLMEGADYLAKNGNEQRALTASAVQAIGLLGSAIIWGIGFGWLSRRFERQADMFGAQCVAPDATDCRMPCSVHLEADTPADGMAKVCMSGAAVFASALDRVAVLNGIPHEERSWRHSSIGSRMRFLTSLAGDPNQAAQFDRDVRRAKLVLLVLAVLGTGAGLWVWLFSGHYAGL